jgi:uncharacterized BrkB/YihY/UPF0761 family membrane protein
MVKFVKILGYVLLVAAALFIVTGYVLIAVNEGFGKLQEILSPFNIWTYGAVIVTLAPGIALIWLSDWLAASR